MKMSQKLLRQQSCHLLYKTEEEQMTTRFQEDLPALPLFIEGVRRSRGSFDTSSKSLNLKSKI